MARNIEPMAGSLAQTEKTLAVVADWGLLGSFGLAFTLSGFSEGSAILALIGFGLFIVGFVAHVIINRTFRSDFNNGEIAVGFITFGVALLVFILSWPGLGTSEIVVGIAGFGALIAAFATYVITRYGLQGAFSMFHRGLDR